jgi:glutamate synthase (NADPH/NADH) small chain
MIISSRAEKSCKNSENENGVTSNRKSLPTRLSETGKTTKPGGDIVTGSAAVILAMGAGRKAGNSIHDYLMNK